MRRSILTKWCSTHFFISRLYLHAFLSWVAGVGGTRLAEDEVVRAEQLPERARAHGVHRARLEVHEDRARDVAAARRLVENQKMDLEAEAELPSLKQDTQRDSEDRHR